MREVCTADRTADGVTDGEIVCREYKTCYSTQKQSQNIQLKWLPIVVAVVTDQQYRKSMFWLLLTTSDHHWYW